MIDDGVEADPPTLIAAARAGDRAAFGRLYRRYARMVHGIALARLRAEDADDVVQEVFVRALDRLHRLRDAHAFGGSLASIAKHLVLDLVRRASHQADPIEDPAHEPMTAEDQHQQFEARRALEAIRALPDAYRETLMLRLVEGMTGPEIAARTGLTAGSVRVNLHRGLKMLRERLESVT
jgi:RNA polymerase sigma-70 factor (ECF subfamily)